MSGDYWGEFMLFVSAFVLGVVYANLSNQLQSIIKDAALVSFRLGVLLMALSIAYSTYNLYRGSHSG